MAGAFLRCCNLSSWWLTAAVASCSHISAKATKVPFTLSLGINFCFLLKLWTLLVALASRAERTAHRIPSLPTYETWAVLDYHYYDTGRSYSLKTTEFNLEAWMLRSFNTCLAFSRSPSSIRLEFSHCIVQSALMAGLGYPATRFGWPEAFARRNAVANGRPTSTLAQQFLFFSCLKTVAGHTWARCGTSCFPTKNISSRVQLIVVDDYLFMFTTDLAAVTILHCFFVLYAILVLLRF